MRKLLCLLSMVSFGSSAVADISGTFSANGSSAEFEVVLGVAPVVYLGSTDGQDFGGGVVTTVCFPKGIATAMVADVSEEPGAKALELRQFRTTCQLILSGATSPDLDYYVQTR